MDLMNVIFYAILIAMLFNSTKQWGRNKKNKKYIKIMRMVEDKDNFFTNVDEFINTINDNEFITKAQILKLYGLLFHNEKEKIDEVLEQINFSNLYTKTGQVDYKLLDLNEDSFFYYCIYSHFLTYQNNDLETRNKLMLKIKEIDGVISDHLFYNIYLNSFDVFESKKMNEYFKNNYDMISGQYSKQLISLYRTVSDCLLYISLKKSDSSFDEMEAIKEELIDFSTKNYGERIMKSLLIFDDFKESRDEQNQVNIEEETTEENL